MTAFVPKRPWWKRWLPVVCWRHRELIWPWSVCVYCHVDALNKEEEILAEQAGRPKHRRAYWSIR